MSREDYESTIAVETVNQWYSLDKEQTFLDYIYRSDSRHGRNLLLEVGGGSGVHGKILAESMRWVYIHSDYSYAMCHAAREKGVDTIQSDGLALPFNDESIDEILSVGASTLVGLATIRMQQFREFYRVLKPRGQLTMVTGRPSSESNQHCINHSDVDTLLRLGFTDPSIRFWGIIPGRFWGSKSRQFYAFLEKTASRVALGERKIVMLKKQNRI